MSDDQTQSRALDSADMRSLRYQFDHVSQALLDDLAIIQEYLSSLTMQPSEGIKRVLVNVQLDLNECRSLISRIEAITQDAERQNPVAAISVDQQKRYALAWLAKQFVGATGTDSSYLIKRFQRAVDGKAEGEPWCVGFVQYCVRAVDELFDELSYESVRARESLYATESTQELWRMHSGSSVVPAPQVGSVVIWRLDANHAQGHCGIVTATDGDTIYTIEGNTSDTLNPQGQRMGNGCWPKTRHSGEVPGFTRNGYLLPWSAP